jgi:hypothetical protein
MIVYDLICSHEHRFEGWFASADDFARQREDALIRCPLCDDAHVERLPSAQVRTGRATPPSGPRSELKSETATITTVAGDAETLKLIRRLIANTENVGRAFAEEARKIHYEEVPARGIRGQATPEEAESLRDEGIDFLSLPGILGRDLD